MPDDSASTVLGKPELESVGDSIGPYRLLQRLGEGGFGVVYLAERRTPIVQRVALKIIKPGMDSRAVIARFEQERQALAVMDHPNVARVFDAGATAAGRPYFVMEHVRGEPITEYCDRQRLSVRQRLALFIPVCDAVQHAHHKGLIHRDIKPSNVLVIAPEGESAAPTPKVIDFGVAKAISHTLTDKTVFTEIGRLIGTPEYMSPEQAEMGATDVDTRTDVYSLGVLLYELLTGALPFDPAELRSKGYNEIQRMIREVEPPRPSTRLTSLKDGGADIAARRHARLDDLARELRRELEWIPLKAMRKDRSERYHTPLDIAEDIARYLKGDALNAGPESASYRLRKLVRRNKGPVFASSMVLISLLLGLAGTLWKAQDARSAAITARTAEFRQRELAESEAAARRLAEAKSIEATQAREESDRQREVAVRQSYMANLTAADMSVRLGDTMTARSRLDACAPLMRGWEWRYLDATSDGGRWVVPAHDGGIIALAESPDGTCVATASSDATVKVWDLVRNVPGPIFTGHRDRVIGVTWSREGDQLLSWSTDGTARIWDVTTGGALHTLDADAGVLTRAALSSDDTVVVTGYLSGAVRTWNLASGAAAQLEIMQGPISGVAYSPTKKYFAVAGGMLASIWDETALKKIASLQGHTSDVFCVTFSPDGKRLATTSWDGTVRLWNVPDGKPVAVCRGHDGLVSCADFSPDNGRLVTGGLDATARLFDANTGILLAVMDRHTGCIRTARFSPDGETVLTAAEHDTTPRLWSAQTGRHIMPFRGHTQSALAIAFAMGGTQVIAGAADGMIRVYDIADDADARLIARSAPAGKAVAFGSDANRLFVGAADGSITLWNLSNGQTEAQNQRHEDGVTAIANDLMSKVVISASIDHTARVWDEDLRERTSLVGHSDSLFGVDLSTGGARAVTASRDQTARIWDVATGREIACLTGHTGIVFDACFSPDGRYVLTASQDKTARVWDTATHRCVRVFDSHSDYVVACEFSSDGATAVTGSLDHTALVWNVATGRTMHVLKGHHDRVAGVAFSPDGSRILTSSDDWTARAWDAESGSELLVLRGKYGPMWSASFSSDGRLVATVSRDGPVQLWDSIPNRIRLLSK